MHADFRGAGIEDLVKALLKTEIGNLMSAINHSDIFRRESGSDQIFERTRAMDGFGAGFDNGGIPAGNRGDQHTEGEQNWKIERGDDQGHAIRHFVNLCDQAGKTCRA